MAVLTFQVVPISQVAAKTSFTVHSYRKLCESAVGGGEGGRDFGLVYLYVM